MKDVHATFCSCSQCSFSAKFESALMMHRQLHHNCAADELPDVDKLKNKTSSLPLVQKKERSYSPCSEKRKSSKGPSRTSSATRLFDKLRTRICRSKTLFVHQEEGAESVVTEPSPRNHRSTNILKVDPALSECTTTTVLNEARCEKYSCHLCSFNADRITVLDRHLLNHHKIGLENLLKLVLAKTKDGLSDDTSFDQYGVRQPYYKQTEDIIEEGEFIIETVTPKIKILKHAAVNTDLKWNDIPEIKNNYKMIKKELERLIDSPIEDNQKDKLLLKMQSLNECMCKFVDSSNTLKKVLTKGFDSKNMLKNEHTSGPVFSLGLGDQETSREWERPHSEKLERNKCKCAEIRSEKKCSTESFYF